MKAALSLLAATLILAALLLLGCVPGLESVKGPAEPQNPPAPKRMTGQAKTAPAPKSAGKEAGQTPSNSAPAYTPPAPPGREKISEAETDLRLKDEVNESARKFAKEIPNVIHFKTCYSKLDRGWWLNIYRQTKKKISSQQYMWNEKSKEWEIVGPPLDVPPKELEFRLKGEVPGEKCFRLK